MSEVEVREGELIWYNERKGYEFVKIGDAEVFLHRSTLDRFGLIRLLTGDKVSVSLTTNEHGQVIQDLLTVNRPVSPAPPAATEPAEDEVRAVVKFFNDLRGYGFVTALCRGGNSRLANPVIIGFHCTCAGLITSVRVRQRRIM